MITFRRVVFDIEADAFYDDVTTIWCVGVMDLESKTNHIFYGDTLAKGIELVANAEVKVAHNGMEYDVPVIKKVLGVDVAAKGTVVDTCILSRLTKPDFLGGHSIEAWGRRLNLAKMDFHEASKAAGIIPSDAPKGAEFQQWSKLMNDYCQRDVEVTAKALSAIIAMAKKDGWGDTLSSIMQHKAVRIEHEMQKELSEQERRGWKFRVEKAQHLLHRMRQAVECIDHKVKPKLPLRVVAEGNGPKESRYVKKPTLGSGKPSKATKDRWGDDAEQVKGPYTRITFEAVDPNSDEQLKSALLQLGWRPTEYTEKGSPRLTEDSLEEWGGRLGLLVARRLMYRHRIGLVKGLLESVRPDGKVGAGGIAQGAVTGRVAHRVVANIPRVSSPMGKAIRSLFCADEGYVQIGADASGLELRCLAHYLNKPKITELICDPEQDFHQFCADGLGMDRDCSKTTEYAWLYGSGDLNLGRTARLSKIGDWFGTAEEGKMIRARLLDTLDAKELIDKVSYQANNGFITGLDGRRIPIRSDHAALNTLLQSCGAIIMKVAYLKLLAWLRKNLYIDAWVVCFYHDEYQVVCRPDQAERVARVMERCIVWAGEHFKLNAPLAAEAKIGHSWKECH
jgi:DNA polymerase-1